MNNIVVGTAGHIDHGKTTLIRALTGIETDRLKEEKQRGITIELGFAYFDLPSGKRVGIVDVPGHEKFIKNMLAGVSGIDLVLFVIAADEGIMPQTQEHLDILSILEVEKGIVVLTKADLVDEDWLEMVTEEIKEQLKDTFLKDAPFVNVSSINSTGIEALKVLMDEMTNDFEDKLEELPLRLPIDRVFSVSGFGTVITGTLFEGSIAIGDVIEIYPSGKEVKVRNIQVHSVDKERAYAGQRVAVNLAGVKKDEINRGDILGRIDSLKSSMMIDVKLDLLKSSKRTIDNWTRLRLYHGTREILCRAVLLDQELLNPGESCYAQLRLEEEIACKYGDKFVVRFYSPLETIGGGFILDSNALKHKRFKDYVIKDLDSKSAGRKEDIIEALIENNPDLQIDNKYLIKHIGLGDEEINGLIEGLVNDNLIVKLKKGSYIHVRNLYKTSKDLKAFLGEYHKNYPFRVGVLKEEVRSKYFAGYKMKLVDEILVILVEREFIMTKGNYISQYGFEIVFTDRAEKVLNKIKQSYSEGGFTPPLFGELETEFSNEKYFKDIFNSVLVDKLIVRINDTIYLDAKAMEMAKQLITDHLEKMHEISLGEVRDLLNTSRKFAVPIIEYFDNSGLTKRVEDKRVLK